MCACGRVPRLDHRGKVRATRCGRWCFVPFFSYDDGVHWADGECMVRCRPQVWMGIWPIDEMAIDNCMALDWGRQRRKTKVVRLVRHVFLRTPIGLGLMTAAMLDDMW